MRLLLSEVPRKAFSILESFFDLHAEQWMVKGLDTVLEKIETKYAYYIRFYETAK